MKIAAITSPPPPVPPSRAVWRGFTMRCPHCARAPLFGRFLKVVDHCAACGEDYSHHRADDFPPYLVIIVLGHTVVPAALAVEVAYAPPLWLHAAIWLPLVLLGALALLQPTKGAVVALQWHLGMHGFEPAKKRCDAAWRSETFGASAVATDAHNALSVPPHGAFDGAPDGARIRLAP
jgi:uncharacterized protein (DUF983 family)